MSDSLHSIRRNADQHFWPQAIKSIQQFCQTHSTDPKSQNQIKIIVPDHLHISIFNHYWQLYGHKTELSCSLISLDSIQPKKASNSIELLHIYDLLRQQTWIQTIWNRHEPSDLFALSLVLENIFSELDTYHSSGSSSLHDFEKRWQQLAHKMPPRAKAILSNEAEMIWQLWLVHRRFYENEIIDWLQFETFLSANSSVSESNLRVWINTRPPSSAFKKMLQQVAQHYTVLQIAIDWQADDSLYALTWPEAFFEHTDSQPVQPSQPIHDLPILPSICPCENFEDQAQQAIAHIKAHKPQQNKIALIGRDPLTQRIIDLLKIENLETHFAIHYLNETLYPQASQTLFANLLLSYYTWLEEISSRALMLFLRNCAVLCADDFMYELCTYLEASFNEHHWPAAWQNIERITQQMNAKASYFLHKLYAFTKQLRSQQTLAAWIQTSFDCLANLNLVEKWQANVFGELILNELKKFLIDAHDLPILLSCAEWQTILRKQLENIPCLANKADLFQAGIYVGSIEHTRLLNFDATIVVNADRLALDTSDQLFFNDSVRAELGLITHRERECQQLRDWIYLLSTSKTTIFCWQQYQAGQKVLLSPWLERLALYLASHYSIQLTQQRIEIRSINVEDVKVHMPSPSACDLLPARFSASSINTLMRCPYQFFARYMLGLRTTQNQDESLNKRDYGVWLHELLKEYHQQFVLNSQRNALHELTQLSKQFFAKRMKEYPEALVYWIRWQKQIPIYLAWLADFTQAGWKIIALEKNVQISLSPGSITLHGTADRIDQNDAGQTIVLDYKTGDRSSLKKNLAEHEDQQLAFYGILFDQEHHPITQAAYISLENTEQAKDLVLEVTDYLEWKHELYQQLKTWMQQLADNAHLPANGITRHCQYCEMAGLCRKGAWE